MILVPFKSRMCPYTEGGIPMKTLGACLILISLVCLVFSAARAVLIAGDVDNSGGVDVVDVQLVINDILGLPVAQLTDVDYDLQTNAIDVQLVINAALSIRIDDDSDGLCNAAENNLGTNPDVMDTDGDGTSDSQEVLDYETDPLDPDTDDDGLTDGQEVVEETDPLDPDTDDDGLTDGEEVLNGTNPLQPVSACYGLDEDALEGYCSEGCGADWGTTDVGLCLNSGTHPGDLEIGLVVDGERVKLYDGVNLNHAYGLTAPAAGSEYYDDESHSTTWDGFVVYNSDDTGGDYWILVKIDDSFQIAQNVADMCGCDEMGVGGGGDSGGGTPTMEIVDGMIDVFGVPVHGDGTDAQLVHAATILAEWLDNDEDGVVDNQKVLDAILAAHQGGVCVVGGCNVTVYDDELYIPDGVNPWPYDPATHRFDASVEEILHVVTQFGYAGAYPEVFGEMEGTEIAMALDIARDSTEHNDGVPHGGYGPDAWFHYDDPTCEYNGCQITEYFYWAVTSLVGLQELRCDDIDNEWELCTETLMQQDAGFMALYNNPEYTIPRFAPDGNYTPQQVLPKK